jgi:hypothetical protein
MRAEIFKVRSCTVYEVLADCRYKEPDAGTHVIGGGTIARATPSNIRGLT